MRQRTRGESFAVLNGSLMLLLISSLSDAAADIRLGTSDCPMPSAPEHGKIHNLAQVQRFQMGTKIKYVCAGGYKLSVGSVSFCRMGNWSLENVTCIPLPGSVPSPDSDSDGTSKGPSTPVFTTIVVVLIVCLVIAMVCVLAVPDSKTSYSCQRRRRKVSDHMFLIPEGRPVMLPSYEEAVYGDYGYLLPPVYASTVLVTAFGQDQQVQSNQPEPALLSPSSNQALEISAPPPPYEAVQSAASLLPGSTEPKKTGEHGTDSYSFVSSESKEATC
ncbi:sushi domain-containing protein 6-like [Latimeria chalumnae]|uniref:Sushi domain-containing protein n=1 Tax=Latimeria chalumnae TaxID=7897 RepID=M3XI26_LATCH|nr:PREDICTED: sushi domain-containing protein 6-like [Latimeria chalumnae]|eukprot:XP_005987937.1 PREDICTED: sushi domain-containing protein 6-like [Latimeria chalumnae]